MLTSNSKLKKDGIWSFSLPAGKTCPNAGECLKGCYAMQGFYVMPSVKKAQARNLLATKRASFAGHIAQEIFERKAKMIRIHASGDFYNQKYLDSWIHIARSNPHVKFYAYTKMVLMVKLTIQRLIQERNLPQNITFIFSEGGKQDSLISPNHDRHSRVFASREDLLAAGYADTSEHDTGATGPNHKIGLIYHGAKAKKWSTN